jgi:hypothetical protein
MLRGLRVGANTIVAIGLLFVVIAALLSGFDVMNGGYGKADIQIGL